MGADYMFLKIDADVERKVDLNCSRYQPIYEFLSQVHGEMLANCEYMDIPRGLLFYLERELTWIKARKKEDPFNFLEDEDALDELLEYTQSRLRSDEKVILEFQAWW